jgi:ribosome modulation factor
MLTSGFQFTMLTSGFQFTMLTSGFQFTMLPSGFQFTMLTSGFQFTMLTSGFRLLCVQVSPIYGAWREAMTQRTDALGPPLVTPIGPYETPDFRFPTLVSWRNSRTDFCPPPPVGERYRI